MGKNQLQTMLMTNPVAMPAAMLWKMYNANKNLDRDVRSAEQK